MRKSAFSLLFIFTTFFSYGQSLSFWDDVKVKTNGNYLANPFAGGLNQPQISAIDLNGDSQSDLMIFDRSGNIVLPFINQGSPGTPDYQYAPEYKHIFPSMRAWAILIDYDCDGKQDIFTSQPDSSGITIYRNTSGNGILSFQLNDSLVKTENGNIIFVNATDIPAITDVDSDGDIDILTFDSQGSQVRLFENTGGCNSLNFTVNTNCWGQFEEAGQDNGVFLNTACKRGNNSQNRHSGSTVLAFDYDGDKALDLLLGDLNHPNIVYLHNGGDSSFALIDQVNTTFPPATSPVDIRQFPASFYLDVELDGKNDLIVAPNAPNISLNANQVWYYQNTGTNTNHAFSLVQKDFMVGDMIDLGTNANPAFFDYNGDGLLDMVVGNYLFRESVNQESSGLYLFENIGTANLPEFELVNTDYLNLTSLFNPIIFGLAPTFGDLDNDGDEDLIIGDENGNLHYFQNQANQPNALADFILFAPFFSSIDVGGSATPQLIDLNQDSLLDLIIGEKSGNLNYYENQGTSTAPYFFDGDNQFGFIDVLPECCTGYSFPFAYENNQGGIDLVVGSEEGELFYYQDIQNHLNDTFPLSPDQLGPINEGGRLSVHAADIDGDQSIDFIFGNRRGGLGIYKTDFFSSVEKDLEKLSLLFSPNPIRSGEDIQLSFQSTNDVSIILYSIDGKLLQKKDSYAFDGNHQLSLPQLNAGLYLITLQSKGKILATQKLLVY